MCKLTTAVGRYTNPPPTPVRTLSGRTAERPSAGEHRGLHTKSLPPPAVGGFFFEKKKRKEQYRREKLAETVLHVRLLYIDLYIRVVMGVNHNSVIHLMGVN